MKKLASFILIPLVFLSVAGLNRGMAAGREDNGDSGHLSLDSCSYDFGYIRGDSIAEGILRFHNSGTAPLQILSIFSDCGCTSTAYTSDAVEAGEKGEIRIRFNPKGRHPGPFRKALRIRSTADNARVVVTVKGMVKRDG